MCTFELVVSFSCGYMSRRIHIELLYLYLYFIYKWLGVIAAINIASCAVCAKHPLHIFLLNDNDDNKTFECNHKTRHMRTGDRDSIVGAAATAPSEAKKILINLHNLK